MRFLRSALCALAALPLAAAARDGTGAAAELEALYYDFEVAGYCGMISEEVAAGFRRELRRIRGDAAIDRETLNELRGKAWQAAHREWQNRGLGGFRAWCRNEGRAAADRFLAVP